MLSLSLHSALHRACLASTFLSLLCSVAVLPASVGFLISSNKSVGPSGVLQRSSSLIPSSMSTTAQEGKKSVQRNMAIEGLGEVYELYDAFLIDQWGVMHNGKDAYPGAVDCIDKLAAKGKKIVLLSNSSKRKGNALKNLARMGFSTGSILDVVTSGQIAWDGLQRRDAEPFASLGNKCLVFGNGDEDEEYVTSCGCELAEADSADFLLARGSFEILGSDGMRRYSPTVMTAEGKADVEKVMRIMKERGKPMLVTNPDFMRPGTNDPMPGLLGKAYKEMDGTVYYVGKPYPAVYDTCLQTLQDNARTAKEDPPSINLSAVVAVGDSLPHDILGALRTKMASVFIAGGVHHDELGVMQGSGEVPSEEAYFAAFKSHLNSEGIPDHRLPAFRW